MFGLRVLARFSKEQLRNRSLLNYYCSWSNKTNPRKNDTFSDLSNQDHQLVVNPNDEITPQELAEKSTQGNWKDTFGSLTGYCERPNLDEISETQREGEIDHHIRLSTKFRRKEPDWYGRKIEKLGKSGQVYEAIQVLEKEMLVDDRVMPNTYVFTTLIGILGRVGHHQKAFKLFNQMKKMGVVPDDPTYTALFNSCSKSPDKEDALKKAVRLRELMKEKDILVNIITHQAMIKAFAYLGEVRTAFRIADEAIDEGYTLSGDTYSFLFMACVADKEAGTSLIIKLWRMMRKKKLPFEKHHYNLLLRCIRDCGVGNEATFTDLLGAVSSSISEDKQKFFGSMKIVEKLPEPQTIKSDCKPHQVPSAIGDPINQLVKLEERQAFDQIMLPESRVAKNFPNILNPGFDMSHFPDYKISLPKDPTDRVLLFGGAENILKHMKRDNCTPTIKTFTLLLDTTVSSLDAEDNLLKLMEEHSVKPDVTFFNVLIKRRCLRKEFRNAKDVLDLMTLHKLKPNDMTFGCLAMGCSTENRGMTLLNDMMKLNMLPNVEICNNLVFLSNMNFRYKLNIVKFMKDHKIRPNIGLLKKLETNVQYAKKKILEAETGKEVHEYYKSKEFLRGFELFLMNYRQWLTSMEMEPVIDPLVRYGQPTPKIPDDDD